MADKGQSPRSPGKWSNFVRTPVSYFKLAVTSITRKDTCVNVSRPFDRLLNYLRGRLPLRRYTFLAGSRFDAYARLGRLGN
jgi:hypothetical protein